MTSSFISSRASFITDSHMTSFPYLFFVLFITDSLLSHSCSSHSHLLKGIKGCRISCIPPSPLYWKSNQSQQISAYIYRNILKPIWKPYTKNNNSRTVAEPNVRVAGCPRTQVSHQKSSLIERTKYKQHRINISLAAH